MQVHVLAQRSKLVPLTKGSAPEDATALLWQAWNVAAAMLQAQTAHIQLVRGLSCKLLTALEHAGFQLSAPWLHQPQTQQHQLMRQQHTCVAARPPRYTRTLARAKPRKGHVNPLLFFSIISCL